MHLTQRSEDSNFKIYFKKFENVTEITMLKNIQYNVHKCNINPVYETTEFL